MTNLKFLEVSLQQCEEAIKELQAKRSKKNVHLTMDSINIHSIDEFDNLQFYSLPQIYVMIALRTYSLDLLAKIEKEKQSC